jgi:hypothetical protein
VYVPEAVMGGVRFQDARRTSPGGSRSNVVPFTGVTLQFSPGGRSSTLPSARAASRGLYSVPETVVVVPAASSGCSASRVSR